MKRLSGLFRSKTPPVDRRAPVTDAVLESLEEKASTAELGFRWVPLNRAGDLCERASDRPRALEYYGRAIDVMLEDGQPEPARGLAMKIVRIHPAAIRTLCTLTWLDLASHHMASVVVHLNEYVASANKGDRQDVAGEQIYMMAHVAADEDFRVAAADALDALERTDDANEVRDWVAAGQAPHDGEGGEGDWTDRCLSHALGSNARRVAPPEEVLEDNAKSEEAPDSGDPDTTVEEARDSGAPDEEDAGTDEAREGDTEMGKPLRDKRDPTAKWI